MVQFVYKRVREYFPNKKSPFSLDILPYSSAKEPWAIARLGRSQVQNRVHTITILHELMFLLNSDLVWCTGATLPVCYITTILKTMGNNVFCLICPALYGCYPPNIIQIQNTQQTYITKHTHYIMWTPTNTHVSLDKQT